MVRSGGLLLRVHPGKESGSCCWTVPASPSILLKTAREKLAISVCMSVRRLPLDVQHSAWEKSVSGSRIFPHRQR